MTSPSFSPGTAPFSRYRLPNGWRTYPASPHLREGSAPLSRGEFSTLAACNTQKSPLERGAPTKEGRGVSRDAHASKKLENPAAQTSFLWRSLLFAMLIVLMAAGGLAQAAKAQGDPPIASVQVINNAKHTGAMDVYVDGRRLLDDVVFPSATPYVLVPAGRRTIDFVAGADADNAQPLWTSAFLLESNSNHALVAVDRPNGLAVLAQNDARRVAEYDDAEFFFVHDAPDAPVFDLTLLDPRVPNQLEDVVLNNARYGDMSTYRRLAPRPHDFQLTTPDNTAELIRFRFDLGAFGGKTLVFLLTGRFDDGSFTIIGYDAEGRLVSDVPLTTTGRDAPSAQFIHNMLDVGDVDVYLDDQRLLDDFAFQTATPFLPLPKGRHKIDIVAGADADNAQPLWTRDYSFLSSSPYAVIAIGHLDPPAGEPGLDVVIQANVRLEATSDDVEFFAVHAAPTAEVLDLRLLNRENNQVIGLPANNIAFGETGPYYQGPPAWFFFEITSADNLAQFDIFGLNLEDFGGKTLVLLITGLDSYLSPIIGYDAEGNFVESMPLNTTDEAAVPEAFRLRGNHPNPFHPTTAITFDLPEPARVHLEVVDVLGRTVLTTAAQHLDAGPERALRIEAEGMAAGLYLYRVVAQTTTGTRVRTGRMVLAR